MPPLVSSSGSELELRDRILLWQSCAGPYPRSPQPRQLSQHGTGTRARNMCDH